MRLLQRPLIYEVNTWVWLIELSRKHGSIVTLATVPDEEWAVLAELGVESAWLMGAWERSPWKMFFQAPGMIGGQVR